MRKASRSEPARDAQAGGEAASVSLRRARSSPARIIRSSSLCTTLDSELVCSSVMVGWGGAITQHAIMGRR